MKLRHLIAAIYACLVGCGGQANDPTRDTFPEPTGLVKNAINSLHTTYTMSAGSGFASELFIAAGNPTTIGSVGSETNGELGNGVTAGAISTPIALPSPPLPALIKQIVSGADWTAVLTTPGDVYYWGANDYGQACQGNTSPITTPTVIFNNIQKLGAAPHGLFLVTLPAFDETFACGRNDFGQLGQGDFASPVTTARLVYDFRPLFTEIVGGETHTLFVGQDGVTVTCAGNGQHGECGTFLTNNSTEVAITAMCANDNLGHTGSVHVAAGLTHSLISGVGNGPGSLCGQWGVWGEGNDSSCQLGISPCNSTAHGFTFLFGTANNGGKSILSVSAGPSSSYLTFQGTDGSDHLANVGANNVFQLGTGDTIQRTVWTDIGPFGTSGAGGNGLRITAGAQDAYLWTYGGQHPVYCAGNNASGECGVGNTSQVHTWTTSQL